MRLQPAPAFSLSSSVVVPVVRLEARGKFLFARESKFYVRGVTYGPFRTTFETGSGFDPATAQRDLEQISQAGFNAIRTYDIPPRWLLDSAARYGLRVMAGIPWEQHVTFLDDAPRAVDIETRVRACVRGVAGHEAILCYAIGNEIPASIVRWHSPRAVERFLRGLYEATKSEDPSGLVTYVNYPSTEYLDLSFADLCCFNVYLEEPGALAAYLARLQNIAGERPLLLGEIGLDSLRGGEARQAELLGEQYRAAFAAGSCGAFVFSWTDEWNSGGADITDWNFGLVRRERSAKPVLETLRAINAEIPLAPPTAQWPRVSVVICTHNGARTIAHCLDGIASIVFPDLEVIVVDDGSTDQTPQILSRYDVKVVRTEHLGLSAARNRGTLEAGGEIIAFIDDDAWPDPHWLQYLVATFAQSEQTVGVGGPNLPPPGEGRVADAVARAPGGPTHVLLTDHEAEHIPGCNMAFRAGALRSVGGFDPQFRIAGDDVDLCWRLQQQGGTLGFSPAAVVWHHRRNTVRGYLRQQLNYGRAEADLERKWPAKYNALGHLRWSGRLYATGSLRGALQIVGRRRIYHGTWGTALWQSVYHFAPGLFSSLPTMPEWYLVILLFAAAGSLGWVWPAAFPLLVIAGICAGISLASAALNTSRAFATSPASPSSGPFGKLFWLTFSLHVTQPLARMWGRIERGLTPWRRRGGAGFVWPWPRRFAVWSEQAQPLDHRLRDLEIRLGEVGVAVTRGGVFDRWDLEVRGGTFGRVRLRTAIESHGRGRELARFRVWPRISRRTFEMLAILAAIGAYTTVKHAWPATIALSVVAILLIFRSIRQCGAAMAATAKCLWKSPATAPS